MNNKIRQALLVMPIAMSMVIGTVSMTPVHAAGESAFSKLRENFNQMTDNYGKTGADNNDKGYQTFNNNASANAKASQQQLKQQQKDLNSYYTNSVKNMDSKVNGGNGTAKYTQNSQLSSSSKTSSTSSNAGSNTSGNTASSGTGSTASSAQSNASNTNADTEDVVMYSEGAYITSSIAQTIFDDGENEEQTQAEKTLLEATKYADLQDIAIADAKDYQTELQNVETEAKENAVKEQNEKKEKATSSFNNEKSNTTQNFSNKQDSTTKSFTNEKSSTTQNFSNEKSSTTQKFSDEKNSGQASFNSNKSSSQASFNNEKNSNQASFNSGKNSNQASFNAQKNSTQASMNSKVAEANSKFSNNGGYDANILVTARNTADSSGFLFEDYVKDGKDGADAVPKSFTDNVDSILKAAAKKSGTKLKGGSNGKSNKGKKNGGKKNGGKKKKEDILDKCIIFCD